MQRPLAELSPMERRRNSPSFVQSGKVSTTESLRPRMNVCGTLARPLTILDSQTIAEIRRHSTRPRLGPLHRVFTGRAVTPLLPVA